MSTDIAPVQFPASRLFLSEEQREILRKSALCSKLNSDQLEYFFEVVERTKLDPFTGQIRPDVRKSKDEDGNKVPQLIIITTLQGLRGIGDRSGQLDGESPPEWCGADGQWLDVWLLSDPPVAARASVYRKDRPRPQTATVRWDAFVQLVYDRQGNAVPGPFWRRMGSWMLAKCALAAGFRGAFPNQCSGLYISEEVGGELDPDSEEAIEAEMIRRANAEKQYWDAEREKGNLPIDELQKQQNLRDAREHTHYIPGPPVQQNAVHPLEHTIMPPPNEPRSTTLVPGDWQNFVIRRIQLFKGRTVGSLTPGELQGAGSWMAQVEKSWSNIDEDLRAHYKAIKARLDYEREATALADGLDFSTPGKNDDWRP